MQPDEIQDESRCEAADPADGAEAWTPLDPAHVNVLRVRAAILAGAAVLIALPFDIGPLRETAIPVFAVPGVVLTLALLLAIVYPARRYRAWGYKEGEDELQIKRGNLIRVRTIVPFGRVQHIDVAQGPLQRSFGLATLTLHTAGTQGASVSLPGLRHADAEGLRDRIRAKIRQDLV